MVDQKLCIGCKYYAFMAGSECLNPDLVSLSPVTGRPSFNHAVSLRGDTGACGKEAKGYSPKADLSRLARVRLAFTPPVIRFRN